MHTPTIVAILLFLGFLFALFIAQVWENKSQPRTPPAWDRQLEAQRRAQRAAKDGGFPVDDGYGNRWYPPGQDGIPVCGRTPYPYGEKSKTS